MLTEKLQNVTPNVCSLNVGDIQISTVLEGRIVRDAIKPPFLLDNSDEEVEEIASKANLPADRLNHGFVPVVLKTARETVLFDTGFGPSGKDSGTGLLVEGLAALGIEPSDIDIIAFTHVHPDHILGVSVDGQPVFPNARYAIGRVEFDEWNSGRNIPAQRSENREMFLKLIAPLAEKCTFLESGDSLVGGITAESGFGHSAGHMMYRIESNGRQILLWGDICNHYIFSLQHPESRVSFDDNPDTAIQSRIRTLTMVAEEKLPVVGFHMPFPAIGTVEHWNDSFVWIPGESGKTAD